MGGKRLDARRAGRRPRPVASIWRQRAGASSSAGGVEIVAEGRAQRRLEAGVDRDRVDHRRVAVGRVGGEDRGERRRLGLDACRARVRPPVSCSRAPAARLARRRDALLGRSAPPPRPARVRPRRSPPPAAARPPPRRPRRRRRARRARRCTLSISPRSRAARSAASRDRALVLAALARVISACCPVSSASSLLALADARPRPSAGGWRRSPGARSSRHWRPPVPALPRSAGR